MTDPFNRLRPRLHGIAYRMLGSAAEAEEVVQDAWLRWHGSRDADFDALKGHFSDQEIVELSWTIATINAWNRMAIGMQAPVAERAIQ